MVRYVAGSEHAGHAGCCRIADNAAVYLNIAAFHIDLIGENAGIGRMANGDEYAG